MSEPQCAITVLFTGLVRPLSDTLAKLRLLRSWRDEGVIDHVVFSTWIGVLQEHPEVTSLLDELGARVVEMQEPKVLWHGHFVHQYKTLHFGLMACPERSFVLKVRSDKMEITEQHRQFCLGLRAGTIDLRPSVPEGWPDDILEYRICSSVVIPSLPFFFNDLCFFGLREDLLKLGSLDLSLDLHFPRINPEQIFFSAPFLRRIPLMFQYFRVNPGITHHDAALARAGKVFASSSPFYAKVVLTFLIVLRSYFRVGFAAEGPHDHPPSAQAVSASWNDLFYFDEAPDPALMISAGTSTVHITHSCFLDRFFARIAADAVPGVDGGSYAACSSWQWQSRYDFRTLGYDAEAHEFALGYSDVTGAPLIYPGASVDENRVFLPYWPIDVRVS